MEMLAIQAHAHIQQQQHGQQLVTINEEGQEGHERHTTISTTSKDEVATRSSSKREEKEQDRI